MLQLYHARRPVEPDLRSIKTVMRMDALRCKRLEMVKKEIAVRLRRNDRSRQPKINGHDTPECLAACWT